MLNLPCLIEKGIITEDQATVVAQLSGASIEELLQILVALQVAP